MDSLPLLREAAAGRAPVPSAPLPRIAEGPPPRPNLPFALVGGFVAACAGAALWGGITLATGVQIGAMALGVGILVGLAVRLTGRGGDWRFGLLGGVLALAGCVAGNLLAIYAFFADELGVSVGEVLASSDVNGASELLALWSQPMDLFFCGLAVFEGCRFAMVPRAPRIEPVRLAAA